MTRTTITTNDFTDELADIAEDLAAIDADPVRRARFERFGREDDLILALGALREAVGMTQEDFASAANMSQENVSRIERATDVRMSTITRLAKASGAQIELTAVLPNGNRIELIRPSQPTPVPAPAVRRPAPRGYGASPWATRAAESVAAPVRRRGR